MTLKEPMKDNFAKCLDIVLMYEGGFANNPKDPGGRTMQGVTQNTFNDFLSKRGHPSRDVKTITRNELETIYKYSYWDKIAGDEVPAGVDLVKFDLAVNSGVSRSATIYRTVTQKTLNATGVINGICDQRLAFLRRLGTFRTFGTGWTRRVANVRAKGLAMNAQSIPGGVKAVAKEIIKQDVKAKKASQAAVGVVSSAAAVVVPAAVALPSVTHLWPLVVIAIVVAGIGLAGYFIWKMLNHKTQVNEMMQVVDGL